MVEFYRIYWFVVLKHCLQEILKKTFNYNETDQAIADAVIWKIY